MRVVSLFLPNWPIERLARSQRDAPEADGSASPDSPAILAQRIGNRRLVYAANPTARAAGLRPGMAVAQAQALVPSMPAAIGRCGRLTTNALKRRGLSSFDKSQAPQRA